MTRYQIYLYLSIISTSAQNFSTFRNNGFENDSPPSYRFQKIQRNKDRNSQPFGGALEKGTGNFQSIPELGYTPEYANIHNPNYYEHRNHIQINTNGVTFQHGNMTRLPFNPCYRDDPQASACIKNLVQTMLLNIADGYQPYNIPPMDPFKGKPLFITYSSSIFGGSLDITDLNIQGFCKAKIMNLKANIRDINKFRITIDAFYPQVAVSGKYKMVGNVAWIPIRTDGDWNSVIDGVTALWDIRGTPQQKQNNVFLNITRFGFRSQPEIQALKKFYASNIVPRNKNLNDFAVKFIGRNYKVIYDQMYPWIEKKISDDVMIDLANTGFSHLPLDLLFPLKS